jgi:hypothetical protein
MLALWCLCVGAAVHDGLTQLPWLEGVAQGLPGWLQHPGVRLGAWVPHAPAIGELIFGACDSLLAVALSLLLLQGTRFEASRLTAVGLVPVIGAAITGAMGTPLVALSIVTVPALVAVFALLCGAVALAIVRSGGLGQLVRPYIRSWPDGGSPRIPKVSAIAAVAFGFLVLLIASRAALTPVVEWDSTVYHSALARLWYLERPHPPVIFGPSLGTEISANYPPLFPAGGLVLDLVAGRVTDIGLRLESPLMFAGLVLVIFEFSKAYFGRTAAHLASFLACTAPLLTLYANWSTSYLLTTSLGFVAVLTLICALEAPTRVRGFLAVGLLLGLCVLSSFYGWLFVLIALVIGALGRAPWRQQIGQALIAATSFACITAVWLVRNWIDLGDPLYPLTIPLLHGRGLGGPVWKATQHELSSNANSYWTGSHSLLRLRQLLTELFDRHLVTIGTLPALASPFLKVGDRRVTRAIVFAIVVLLGAELLPGWFWLRALVPAVPFLAIGAGVTLAALLERARSALAGSSGSTDRVRINLPACGYGAVVALCLATVVVGSGSAAAIMLVGPGEQTWVTEQLPGTNFFESDDNLGSRAGSLWTVFGGDYEAWVWLNRHRGGGRVATFDIRNYYLNDPGSIFYLDGQEAQPLYRLRTASQTLAFLRRANVRYIFMPSWAIGPTLTRNPAVNLLPLTRLLGGRDFPLVADFAVTDSIPLSSVYAVGTSKLGRQAALLPGESSPAPGAGGPYVFAAHSTDGTIFVPDTSRRRGTRLVVSYLDNAPGVTEFNAYSTNGTWQLDFAQITTHGSGRWRRAVIRIPPSSAGMTALGLAVGDSQLVVRDAAVPATLPG